MGRYVHLKRSPYAVIRAHPREFRCASAMSPPSLPGVKPVYTVVTSKRQPAVLLTLIASPTETTVQVAQEVHDEIERLRKTLPPGVRFSPFYDQSDHRGEFNQEQLRRDSAGL